MTSVIGLLAIATFASFGTILLWHFLGYPFTMSLIRRARDSAVGQEFLPTISVVLPVYNEEKELPGRVEDIMEQDYPRDRLEIIIVESGSTDLTLKVADELSARFTQVKVVSQPERRGKASAVAAGKNIAQGGIIVVSDANTRYSRGALRRLVQPFADPQVGGVGGRFSPKNSGDPRTSGSKLFWSLEEIMREGEAAVDSACTFHGEIYAWRKSRFDPDPTAIIDDLDMAVQIRRKGYRIGYAPSAVAFETVPTTRRDMTLQWRKNALGTIQCTLRNLRFMILHPNIYNYIIYPSHKGLQCFEPFLIALATAALLVSIVAGVSPFLLLLVLVILALFSLISLLGIRRHLKRIGGINGPSILHPLNWLKTFVSYQHAVLLAWKEYLAGSRDVRWEKVESTRI